MTEIELIETNDRNDYKHWLNYYLKQGYTLKNTNINTQNKDTTWCAILVKEK